MVSCRCRQQLGAPHFSPKVAQLIQLSRCCHGSDLIPSYGLHGCTQECLCVCNVGSFVRISHRIVVAQPVLGSGVLL